MRVLSAMEEPFHVDGLRLEIGLSIGIALHDDTMRSIDADSVFKLADHALYKAKHNGRHGYHLCTDLKDAEGPHASRLVIEMRDAIRREEFHLQYQPIIDCATGQLDGFEALLRWQHPTRGLVPPSEFVPLAEQTGFIRTITQWVLDRAILQCAEWRSRGRAGRLGHRPCRPVRSAAIRARPASACRPRGSCRR